MKIKYVGVKEDGETAFARDVGIERWMKGDVHEVSEALAAKMLQHPDVFAVDKSAAKKEPAAPAPSPAPAAPAAPSDVTLAPGTSVGEPSAPAPAAAKKSAPKKAAAKKPAAKKKAK
jgi:hypothetical protein